MTTTTPRRSDYCIVALAESFRGDGEIFASPMGTTPTVAGRLARATFEPDLFLTDGICTAVAGDLPAGGAVGDNDTVVEGWMPFRNVFDLLSWGRRHVVMGPVQIDRYGNMNISAIGEWSRPKVMLLGMRGAPGNTINHTTSYWVPNHSPKAFVETVDVVSGIGYDRAASLGEVARFHEIRRVVTNLCVLDFAEPEGGGPKRMRLASVHPGVTPDDVVAATGFELIVPADVSETRSPTEEELRLIVDVLDPKGLAAAEVPE